jgi:hypothetical protein
MDLVNIEVALSSAIGIIACVLPRLFSTGRLDSVIPISLWMGLLWFVCPIVKLVR